MTNSIQCPNCGSDITAALVKQAESQVVDEINKKHQAELEDIKKNAVRLVTEDMNKILREKEEELAAYKIRTQKAEETELQLRKERRLLDEAKDRFEIEKQRQLDMERKEIKENAAREIAEQEKYKLAEKDKVINDLNNALAEMKRKAEQGSQQLQGEVFELELEKILPEYFPADIINAIAKGQRGGDVKHTVKSPSGKVECGVILWESKRTKAWSDGWIGKLKEDLRREGADVGIIITTALPSGIKAGIGCINGIWVCNENFILPLAQLIRDGLIKVMYQKTTHENQGRKADLIYQYITGSQFRLQIEAILESYQELKSGIERERAAYERLWKSREGQLQRIILSTAGLYGSMQGLAGGNALPQLKGLDLSLEEPSAKKARIRVADTGNTDSGSIL